MRTVLVLEKMASTSQSDLQFTGLTLRKGGWSFQWAHESETRTKVTP